MCEQPVINTQYTHIMNYFINLLIRVTSFPLIHLPERISNIHLLNAPNVPPALRDGEKIAPTPRLANLNIGPKNDSPSISFPHLK